ncbi:MAG: hypothetical protein ACD_9C00052G0002 [uncultured bacterium]|nr:MAG: hypothetical protein ACD_9C00052G0002 [uncultured bacterium]
MFLPNFVHKISDVIWEIPKKYKQGMLVPARIVATEKLLFGMDQGVFEQITNVAMLPGVVGYAWALPDAHWGYGAPIGGVFATDLRQDGVISPGAIGFDINCGMRLIRTNLTIDQVQPKLELLLSDLFNRIPAGVGRKGIIKLSKKEFSQMVAGGAKWVVDVSAK